METIKAILRGVLTFLSLGMIVLGVICGVYLTIDGIKGKTLGKILLGVFFLLIFVPLIILSIAEIIGI